MTMHKGLRSFIRVTLAVTAILTLFVIEYAMGAADPGSDTITSKDIIMVLFGLLQTVFMGIAVWLISNDRELFTRLRDVETKQAVQTNTCAERSSDCKPDHTHRRAADSNPQAALKETVDNLRKILYTLDNKGDIHGI